MNVFTHYIMNYILSTFILERNMNPSLKYYTKQLEKFVGCKIVHIINDGEENYGFQVESITGDRHNLWIMSDDEGNDCGAVHVETMPSRIQVNATRYALIYWQDYAMLQAKTAKGKAKQIATWKRGKGRSEEKHQEAIREFINFRKIELVNGYQFPWLKEDDADRGERELAESDVGFELRDKVLGKDFKPKV